MKLQDVIAKIEQFRNFKTNWNGYGAEPISEEVINKALDLVNQLNPPPLKVYPLADNGIQFEWENAELYLEMEVYEDKIEIFNQCQYRGETITIG